MREGGGKGNYLLGKRFLWQNKKDKTSWAMTYTEIDQAFDGSSLHCLETWVSAVRTLKYTHSNHLSMISHLTRAPRSHPEANHCPP